MHDVIFASGWDTALIMVPFVGMIALSLLGLDEKLAAPKRDKRRRHFSQLDGSGNALLFDPDGTSSNYPDLAVRE